MYPGDYQSVFSLVTHKERVLSNSSDKITYQQAAGYLVAQFGGHVISGSPVELFTHHLLQTRFNSHTVSASLADQLVFSEEHPVHGVEMTRHGKLGVALYPTLSLVNHSCKPNAIIRFNGNRASLVATQLISAGDQVNISYGPQVGRSGCAQRQAVLQDKYLFGCTCTACTKLCEVQYSYLCTKCWSGPLVQDNTVLRCVECEHSLLERDLSNNQEVRERARRLFKEATQSQPYDLGKLVECEGLQTKVLYRHNMELAKTHDALALAHAMEGDYCLSVHYCELSCESVALAFGEDSIELGNELFKLTQLYINRGGGGQEVLTTAVKARRIIGTHCGTHHRDYQELGKILSSLNQQF